MIIDDVYGLREWRPRHNEPRIVDIGANIGTFSTFAARMFPHAIIRAYEPHPKALPWLRSNAEKAGFSVEPVAVGRCSGTTRLDNTCSSTTASIDALSGYEVTVIGPADVADGEPIDLLKIDCEGAEHEILEDGSLLLRTQSLRMEYHCGVMDQLTSLKQVIQDAGLQITADRPFREAGGLLGIIHAERV